MHFNESHHKIWIRRHLRFTCLCSSSMLVEFLVYFKSVTRCRHAAFLRSEEHLVFAKRGDYKIDSRR